MACFGIVMFGCGLYHFIQYYFPLKLVWMSLHGLRVSNFRDEVIIPFETIEAVEQKPGHNPTYVVITLHVDTPFGRRFTFIPRNPRLRSPIYRGEDNVVVELWGRVEAARKVKVASSPSGVGSRPGRSPMADDELDGPL